MILTTKARYAVMAVIELSSNQANIPLPLSVIAKNQNMNTTPDCENIFVIGAMVAIGIFGDNVGNGANVDIYITTSYFFL